MEREQLRDVKRLVIKVGTSTLTHENGKLDLRHISELVQVLADLKNADKQVLLVSSGAIGAGVGRLGLSARPSDVAGKQAAAAVGQCDLMYTYDKQFSQYGHITAQVLLTQDVIRDARRKENVENTLERLLELGVVPIINENDTVATEELVFGDNDTLAAMVATLVGADLLVLMTDIDGLYDHDPHRDPAAHLIPTVRAVDDDLRALAGGAGSDRGTGGMLTKLNAAERGLQAGIPTAIINGKRPDALYDLLEGGAVGTVFLP